MSWSLHHRVPRGMGGSKTSWINAPSNLILLCGTGTTGCHGWVEANRAVARDQGWIIARGIQRPGGVPIRDPYGRVWLLDDEGGRCESGGVA